MNKGLKIIALAILLTLPMSAGAFAMGDKPPRQAQVKEPPCTEIRLRMGEAVFSLPADVKGLYLRNGQVGDVKADIKPKCYRSDSDLTGVTFFSLLPGKEFPMQEEAKAAPFRMLQIQVLYPSNTILSDPFELAKKSLRAANIQLQNLPIENGFYTWKRNSIDENLKNYYIYIAADSDFLSLNGSPVVFTCDYNNDACWTSIKTDRVSFGVRIRNIPPSRWKEFYQALVQYRDSILVKSNDQQQEVKP